MCWFDIRVHHTVSVCSWISAFCATFSVHFSFNCTHTHKNPAISGSLIPQLINYTRWVKNHATWYSFITSTILNRFMKFSHCCTTQLHCSTCTKNIYHIYTTTETCRYPSLSCETHKMNLSKFLTHLTHKHQSAFNVHKIAINHDHCVLQYR